MQDIIAETTKCEFFFPNKIDKKIYSKIELALKGFFNILALIKESDLKILVVPSSLKPQELMLNQNFIKFLAKKVVVLRNSTERPESIENGNVILIHVNQQKITKQLKFEWNHDFEKMNKSPYGNGNASKKIIKILKKI